MIGRPQIKPSLHAECWDADAVFFLSERGHSLLRGRLYGLVVPLIDGRRTAAEIVDLLDGQASAAEVYYALTLLESKGYLVEACPELPPGAAAFWSTLGVPPQAAAERLAGKLVAVVALGGVDAKPLVDMLCALDIRSMVVDTTARVRSAGASLCRSAAPPPVLQLDTNARATGDRGAKASPPLPRADFAVVVTDDYLRPELDSFNTAALAAKVPWMLVKPVGSVLWIGPIFRPGTSGCWACLAQRLEENRPLESMLLRRKADRSPLPVPQPTLATTYATALSLAATQASRWLATGENNDFEGIIRTVDAVSGETQRHVLVRRPQCPACGLRPAPAERCPAVVFESRPKQHTHDGGHRAILPEETVERYGHHVSPITGAVSALQRIAVDGKLINLYFAGENRAMWHDGVDALRSHLRSSSGGKGVGDAQAKASALGEALERYSCASQGDEVALEDSYRALGERAVDPRSCLLFSDRQYRERAAWNSRGSRFNYVPEPFDPDRPVAWTALWSLTHRQVRYLPTNYCYFGHSHDSFAIADSNGCAGGNTIEEAVLQGFLELVERDSVALWWYNRLSRPAVDLDSLDVPFVQELRAYYRARERDLWVLDITGDLGIPACAAASRRLGAAHEDIMVGFGAHLDPKIAVLRALTEANQLLPRMGSRSASAPEEDPELAFWLDNATLANQPYLAPSKSLAPRPIGDFPQLATNDLRDDVVLCQQIVERKGLEMLVLDVTRPDIGYPVARVVVPGLRHFWARFAPGRLYDVPAALGWLDHVTKEEDVNPIPMFL